MTTVLNLQGDEHVRRLVDWVLSEDGFTVVNGLGSLTSVMPDVIVIDSRVESDDADSSIGALRQTLPGVPVVDLGAGVAHDTNADAYLNMPFSAEDLISRVRACAP